ncbi:FAD-dependent oxidoreductase [bacterium]|nr:FAD-dependent oxidoreductase [bacterium]
MRKETDVLVLGGGPAGIISAVTARKYYPNKKIVVIKSIEKGVVPCGIPYMFSTLKNPEENKLGNAALEKNNVEVFVDEAVKIERKDRVVTTKKKDTYHYEKLILAVGSDPIVPPIPGIDKKGIYPVYKEMDYLKNAVETFKKAKNILVLGGGFIGIEFADELAKLDGVNVCLAEMLPDLLNNSFDSEFSELVEEKLKANGVKVLTNVKVEGFLGNDAVEKVKLSNGSEIAVDCVVLGIGAFPNTKIANEADLRLGMGKGIWVDEYMRTVDSNIFAVGDCAGKRDFFTRKDAPVMLASTATAEARIAGSNLYQLKVVREIKGTIAIYSTYINDLALASAGLTENNARKEGFEIVVGMANSVDKHPATMPDASKLKVKLIFSRQSGIIMGGQVAGGISCGEIINIIGIAIQKRISLTELETLQMATHPCLTSAPTMYPLVLAAQDATSKI